MNGPSTWYNVNALHRCSGAIWRTPERKTGIEAHDENDPWRLYERLSLAKLMLLRAVKPPRLPNSVKRRRVGNVSDKFDLPKPPLLSDMPLLLSVLAGD